jgi:hypothetical protein
MSDISNPQVQDPKQGQAAEPPKTDSSIDDRKNMPDTTVFDALVDAAAQKLGIKNRVFLHLGPGKEARRVDEKIRDGFIPAAYIGGSRNRPSYLISHEDAVELVRQFGLCGDFIAHHLEGDDYDSWHLLFRKRRIEAVGVDFDTFCFQVSANYRGLKQFVEYFPVLPTRLGSL